MTSQLHIAVVPSSFHSSVNFAARNERALPHLVAIMEDLLHLDIKEVSNGNEIQFLNPLRFDTEFGSASINALTGKWGDFAEDDEARGGDVTSLVKYTLELSNQFEAAERLEAFLDGLEGARPGLAVDPATPLMLAASSAVQSSEDNLAAEDAMAAVAQQVSVAIKSVNLLPEIESPAKEGEEVPPLNPRHREFGPPAHVHIYRDANGRPTSTTCRYEKDGKKTFVPYILERSERNQLLWSAGMHKTLRPLYQRDQIARRPDAIIVVCEGEKAANAAALLLPDAVATTTMGGAHAASKSDFRPLAGRTVLIAPDNDEAGQKYKDEVIRLARQAGATEVGVIRYPNAHFGVTVEGRLQDVPRGYDLADAVAAGWNADRMSEVMDQFVEVVSSPELVVTKAVPGSRVRVAQGSGKVSMKARAAEFVDSQFSGLLVHDGSGFRGYRDGYWPMLDEVVDLQKPLLTFLGESGTPRQVKDYVSLLAMMYACRPEDFERAQSYVCLTNGALNPLTSELHPHSPEHYLSNRLAVAWNADAKCPLWLQTLDEIFLPDLDKAQKLCLLQEFFGYCLIPDTTMHKFLWLVGAGGNGKSLVLGIVESIVGRVNVSHAQLERLQDKFVRAELKGKLVNISSEMSPQATISDGYLKQITAGDMIEAERKFEPSFSFKPYVRLIGATNELPRLLDHSDGFFRRAIILTFNRRFSEAEQDRTLSARLEGELPGILAWAIAGLQRLLIRKSFDVPPSSSQALAQYRVESNPVQQFAEEFLERPTSQDDWVTAQSLYTAYKEWSSANGYKLIATSTFKSRLEALGYQQSRLSKGRFWQVSCVGQSLYVERFGPQIGASRVSPLASQFQV